VGVLYYFQRENDSELFALNKVYRYAPALIGQYAANEWHTTPSRDEVEAVFPEGSTDWAKRVHVRIVAWADEQRIRCVSENFFVDDGLTYEEDSARITGSAHDSDYESDGVSYKPGSAW